MTDAKPGMGLATDAALRVLSKDRDGLILMVEGAHIDKQSHAMALRLRVTVVLGLAALGPLSIDMYLPRR